MEMLRDADIDPAQLEGKRVAILGYGNQGRAQSLNLKDSGIDVVVGLRGRSGSTLEAEAAGLETALLEKAVSSADVVMMLAPDETHAALYREIEPYLRRGAALGFSHGTSVRFGFVEPRSDLDVFMVAPKGPGTALRSLYLDGKGMISLWAVANDATGSAREIALAYGRSIGSGRAGLIASTFGEEAEADLFNEQAVVWGGVPEILIAGFDTLVAGGISPEVAYLECVGELRLIAELIEARGIAGMKEVISNTAELGALIGGKRIVDESVRARMGEVLAEVRAGRFAQQLRAEEAAGYPRLEKARNEARSTLLQRTYEKLSGGDLADRLGGQLHFGTLTDACPLEIGALHLPVSFGRLRGRRHLAPIPVPRQRGARNRSGPRWPWRAPAWRRRACSRSALKVAALRRAQASLLRPFRWPRRGPASLPLRDPSVRPAPICPARGLCSG